MRNTRDRQALVCVGGVNRIGDKSRLSATDNVGSVLSTGIGGLAVRRWTCNHIGDGFESHRGHLHNNLGQVVHTYVPLSSSSITCYWLKDGDVLQLGRWLQAWWKVMAAYCWGWLKKSPSDCLYIGIGSVTSMGNIVCGLWLSGLDVLVSTWSEQVVWWCLTRRGTRVMTARRSAVSTATDKDDAASSTDLSPTTRWKRISMIDR